MTAPLPCLANFVNDILVPLHGAAAGRTFEQPRANKVVDDDTIGDLERALIFIPADDYGIWIKMAHALATLGDRGFSLWISWSQKSHKFQVDYATRVWKTLKPNRINHCAVFTEAESRGWVYSGRPDFTDVEVPEFIRDRKFSTRGKPWPEAEGTQSKYSDGKTWRQEQGSSERRDGFNESVLTFQPISNAEWANARSTPDCIVENLYYADVAVLIAPGGTGKTTLLLLIAIHIALGIELFGLAIKKRGPVAIISAEDSREMLVARLRSISREMSLTAEQTQIAMRNVLICDVSGMGLRLAEVDRDVVKPADKIIDQILRACSDIEPVMIVIDPAVSFGVGESRVNDAEQGLVEAARRLRKALNCCVLYIHHTGKQNARDKASDQYAGRGGSAFADGARMVHVLQSMSPAEWERATGQELLPDETGLILARPKMSYTKPQHNILIRRNHYRFEHTQPVLKDASSQRKAHADLVWQVLSDERLAGRFPTQNSIETMTNVIGLKRNEIRSAIHWLRAEHRVEDRDLPSVGQRGSRRYLHAVAAPGFTGETALFSSKEGAGEI